MSSSYGKILSLKDIKAKEIVPGFEGKFIHSETMTFAYWTITKGSTLPEHSHHHEQVCNVLEGTFELVVDGETLALGASDVVVIPSNATHSGRAISDCKILDVFQPPRDDYRNNHVVADDD